MTAHILARDPDLQVLFAENVAEALERLDAVRPDLVLTDLVLPDISGLELVRRLQESHPQTPVVLMTSKGSEKTAVDALTAGAASYVPKSALNDDLLGTVYRVLLLSGERREKSRILDCLQDGQHEFEIPTDPSLIGPLVRWTQEALEQAGVLSEADSVQVGVALEEALANALHHGNLELSSSLRESDPAAYDRLVKERCETAPFCDRKIRFTCAWDRNRIRFVVVDEGNGFDPSVVPDPRNTANLEKVSGRGLLLVKTFMDDVDFNEKGNEITLLKHRNGSAPDSGESG